MFKEMLSPLCKAAGRALEDGALLIFFTITKTLDLAVVACRIRKVFS